LHNYSMSPNRTHLGLQVLEPAQCVVIDHRDGLCHYRTCTDKQKGIAPELDIDWDSIVLVDFKLYPGLAATDPVWTSLQQVLDNDQSIKILHLACSNTSPQYNTMIEYADLFKDIAWNGQLIIEYYYHNYPGEIAPIVQQLTSLIPSGVAQADLYIDGMNLHIPLL
jgi:hypothetical protein